MFAGTHLFLIGCSLNIQTVIVLEGAQMGKKITAWSMTAAMFLFGLLPLGTTTYAEDNSPVTITPRIVGTAASDLSPGEKIYVDVSVSPVSTCAFAINASWDTNDLELTDAIANSSFYNGSSVPYTYVPFNKSGGDPVPEKALKDYQNKRTSDVCVFEYVSGENLDCSGVAVTLEFTVKQGANNGYSEIDVYFDPENPPESFGPNYENIIKDFVKASDIDKVVAEIDYIHTPAGNTNANTNTNAGTNTNTTTETEAASQMPEVTKPFDENARIVEVTDETGFYTEIIIDPPEETFSSYPEINNGMVYDESVENTDNIDDDNYMPVYNDDVSAAAGTSDRAGENIKRIAISCTAVLAAGLVVLMAQKQKRKNNGSDRIK